jgi:hypothetical protein
MLRQGQRVSLVEAVAIQHDMNNSAIIRLLAWPILQGRFALVVDHRSCRPPSRDAPTAAKPKPR